MLATQYLEKNSSTSTSINYAPASTEKLLTDKTTCEWEKLSSYTREIKDAYFFKFIVKIASKQNNEENRFLSLFNSLKENLHGGGNFLPSQVSFIAADYIQAESRLRDFDLIIFWKHVTDEHPALNLPQFEEAEQIRLYLKSNTQSINQITFLRMNGIFEIWSDWHTKYGHSLSFPFFETEKEIHQYLENRENMSTIIQVLSKERETILAKTTRLPPEIKYFLNLEELTFSNRKALTLPKEVFSLRKLKILNICHSELQKLSKKIELTKDHLLELRLIGTQFTSLPCELLKLKLSKILVENKTQINLSLNMRNFLNTHTFSSLLVH